MTTNDIYLPSREELTVPELKLTSSELRAGSVYFGKYCDDICKEFMMCKQDNRERSTCLNEGKEVTKCGFEFFGKVKKHCAAEFFQYYNCIDHCKVHETAFEKCRGPQAIFDKCAKEKIGVERPYIGFFSKPRVYTGDRPAPPPEEIIMKSYRRDPETRRELNEREMKTPLKDQRIQG